MRSLPGRLRSLDPVRADALLALVFLVEAAVEIAVLVPAPRPHFAIAVLSELVLALALAVRRRWALASVIGAFGALCVITAISPVYTDHMIGAYFVVLFLIYSAGRHLDDRRVIVAGVVGSTLQLVTLGLDSYHDSLANVASS